jgi:hypothetical protein
VARRRRRAASPLFCIACGVAHPWDTDGDDAGGDTECGEVLRLIWVAPLELNPASAGVLVLPQERDDRVAAWNPSGMADAPLECAAATGALDPFFLRTYTVWCRGCT